MNESRAFVKWYVPSASQRACFAAVVHKIRVIPSGAYACNDLPPSLASPHQIEIPRGPDHDRPDLGHLFVPSLSQLHVCCSRLLSFVLWSSDRLVLNSKLRLLRSGWAPLWGETSPEGYSSPPPASSVSRSATHRCFLKPPAR